MIDVLPVSLCTLLVLSLVFYATCEREPFWLSVVAGPRVSVQGGFNPTIGEQIELVQAGLAGITNPIPTSMQNDLSVAYRTLHTSFNRLGRYG